MPALAYASPAVNIIPAINTKSSLNIPLATTGTISWSGSDITMNNITISPNPYDYMYEPTSSVNGVTFNVTYPTGQYQILTLDAETTSAGTLYFKNPCAVNPPNTTTNPTYQTISDGYNFGGITIGTGGISYISVVDGGTIKIVTEEQSEEAKAEIKRWNFKNKIKSNLTVIVKSRHKLVPQISAQEIRARQTLRDMLTEKEYRRYITNGFIMVKGERGWYQIFNTQERIRFYKDNKLCNYLCIHTDRECPPTDHVIHMKLLLEINEDMLWTESNVSDCNYNRCDQNGNVLPNNIVTFAQAC